MGRDPHAGGTGVVTVCIPAWQAADFIDRTLRRAREQTYDALRIVVSIDRSDDDTGAICHRHAGNDPRVEVLVHRDRLGWARNVNFLLERVDTEFAFLYFHDDLIEPTYTARLVSALRERPDAASAHCDMGHFFGSDHTAPARGYEGSPAERLLTFLVVPDKGSMLRSMLRTDAVGQDLRLPTGSQAGVWANEPFLMRLVAAGPVLAVHETLYVRWDDRPGGLTDSWRSLPFDDILDGYRVNAEVALEIIDGLAPSKSEREALVFGLSAYMVGHLRAAEARYGARSVTRAASLHPELAGTTVPAAVDDLAEPLRTSCLDAFDTAQRATARRAFEVRDYRQIASTLATAVHHRPRQLRSWVRIAADAGRAAREPATGPAAGPRP